MTKSNEKPQKPPKHLVSATKKRWAGVMAEYVLEPHHVRLLTLAAESWDRCQQARETIAKEGLTFVKDGVPRRHPAVQVEQYAKIAFARLIRELALDVSAPDDSRPPSIKGRYR